VAKKLFILKAFIIVIYFRERGRVYYQKDSHYSQHGKLLKRESHIRIKHGWLRLGVQLEMFPFNVR
jgi:hypothetical protein